MPGTSWPRRCSARISGMPIFGHPGLVAVPAGRAAFRPYLTGSQQASGMSSGIGRMPRPRGRVKAASPGGAGAQVVTGMPGHAEASAMVSPGRLARLRLVPAVAGGAEHAAGVVAAPGMPAVRAEEHVVPAAAVLGRRRRTAAESGP